MFAASYGIAFGAIQQLPQILSGHAQIVADGQTAVEQVAEASDAPLSEGRRKQIAANSRDETVAKITIWQEIGGLVGRFLLAALAVRIVSRRTVLRIFQLPALIFVPLLFWWISTSAGKCRVTRQHQDRHLHRGLAHGGPIQLLGQLDPASFPTAPAWDRQKLCGAHQWPNHRHRRRVADVDLLGGHPTRARSRWSARW